MKLRLIRIVAILLLAVSGFAVVALLETFGRKPEKLQAAAPRQADWVVRVDAATLLKEEAFTVLFEEKDEQLLKTLRTFAESSADKEERPKLFINLFSEIVVFGARAKGHTFTGILLELTNPKAFEQNIPAYLNAYQTVAVEGNTALILTRTDQGRLARELQTEISQSLLASRSETSASRNQQANEYVRLELKSPSGKVKKADVGMLFSKNAISLDGKMTISGAAKMADFDVKHTKFYMSSTLVPADMAHSVFRKMQLGELQFPQLESMSLNYDGIIIENGTYMFRLPKINAVVTTKTPVNVQDLVAQAPEQFRLGTDKLKFSNTVYYFEQLNDRTFFFGLDRSQIVRKSPENPVMLKGDLRELAEIEADGMIMTGINILVPQYSLFDAFAKSTKKIDVKLKPVNGENYALSGSLEFTDKSSVLAVLTRLFLGFKGFN